MPILVGEELAPLGYTVDNALALDFSLNETWHDYDLRMSYPSIAIGKVAGDLEAPRASVRFLVKYLGRHSSGSPDSGNTLSITDEVFRLARMSAIVMQRVWEELAFSTYEAAAQMTAQALARTIELRSTKLAICGVSLSLFISQPETKIKQYTANITKPYSDSEPAARKQPLLAQQPCSDGQITKAESRADVATKSEGIVAKDGGHILRSPRKE